MGLFFPGYYASVRTLCSERYCLVRRMQINGNLKYSDMIKVNTVVQLSQEDSEVSSKRQHL